MRRLYIEMRQMLSYVNYSYFNLTTLMTKSYFPYFDYPQITPFVLLIP